MNFNAAAPGIHCYHTWSSYQNWCVFSNRSWMQKLCDVYDVVSRPFHSSEVIPVAFRTTAANIATPAP